MKLETDDRGRITIPRAIRDQYGDRYHLVELDDGLKLVPVPTDPVASLRAAASEALKQAVLPELREAAIDEACGQATEPVR